MPKINNLINNNLTYNYYMLNKAQFQNTIVFQLSKHIASFDNTVYSTGAFSVDNFNYTIDNVQCTVDNIQFHTGLRKGRLNNNSSTFT